MFVSDKGAILRSSFFFFFHEVFGSFGVSPAVQLLFSLSPSSCGCSCFLPGHPGFFRLVFPRPRPSSTPLPASRSALAAWPACRFSPMRANRREQAGGWGRRRGASLGAVRSHSEFPRRGLGGNSVRLAFSERLRRWGLTVPHLSGEGGGSGDDLLSFLSKRATLSIGAPRRTPAASD